MSYSAISKTLIRAGKSFTTTLAELIRTNFVDHESRIDTLEGTSFGLPAGIILPYGGGTVPPGFLACDGSTVGRATYPGLFAAIGEIHGAGDGVSTFVLPDSRGRALMGAGSTSGLTTRNLGSILGAETHQVSEAEMPSHSHTLQNDSHIHYLRPISVGGGGALDAFSLTTVAPTQDPAPTASNTTGMTVNSVGSDGAHNNMQRSLVATMVIKT